MTARRILVIDDEQSIREVVQICLQTVAGWQVMTTGSGNEGVLKAEVEQPDAILLDIMMPENGFVTFQKLQANPFTQGIPVIALTARVQGTDRRHYIKLGMKAAIAKPFNPLKLADQIAEALGWSLQNEPLEK